MGVLRWIREFEYWKGFGLRGEENSVWVGVGDGCNVISVCLQECEIDVRATLRL
jgi:hypothetical protein